MQLLGLRTIIYPAPDLVASKAWFTTILGVEPYFDETFYVGFQVAGYELALDPGADPTRGPITYWGVGDAHSALTDLLASGATADSDGVLDVGDDIRVATVREIGGSVFGVIENPHFHLSDDASPTSVRDVESRGISACWCSAVLLIPTRRPVGWWLRGAWLAESGRRDRVG